MMLAGNVLRCGCLGSIQDDLFEDRLTLQYEVKPNDKWSALRKYKKFSVGSESIGYGECVLVKHEDGGENGPVDHEAQWKAKVLEIRALDTEHVYIRVAWLNRPEDLDIGRRDYHGRLELIPTNQMDIIDAMAVNGRLEVIHWDELADEDDQSMPQDDQYFWRYTYDFAHTKSFSVCRLACCPCVVTHRLTSHRNSAKYAYASHRRTRTS